MDQITEFFNNLGAMSIGNFNLNKIIFALIVAVISIVVVKIILRVIKKLVGRLNINETLKVFILKTFKFVLYFIAILIIADSMGIPITSLLALFSVLGLAASLAVQGFLTNIAGGVSILASKPFSPGNFVEVGGVSGSVKEIGLIHTKLATPDNKIIYVPNSEISASKIINFSAEDKRLIVLNVTASYDCKIEDVKTSLLNAVKNTKEVIDIENTLIGVSDYKASSIEYIVKAWVKTDDYWSGYFALNENVKYAFENDNIEMTYDHINVHMTGN